MASVEKQILKLGKMWVASM